MSWNPTILELEIPGNPEELSNVHPLLRRIVRAFSAAGAARMIDVNPSMITRWEKGGQISPEMCRRISDLHDVLSRALRVMRPRTAMLWFIGSNPHLQDARPIDVLAVRGPAPVISALEAFEDLAYS